MVVCGEGGGMDAAGPDGSAGHKTTAGTHTGSVKRRKSRKVGTNNVTQGWEV